MIESDKVAFVLLKYGHIDIESSTNCAVYPMEIRRKWAECFYDDIKMCTIDPCYITVIEKNIISSRSLPDDSILNNNWPAGVIYQYATPELCVKYTEWLIEELCNYEVKP